MLKSLKQTLEYTMIFYNGVNHVLETAKMTWFKFNYLTMRYVCMGLNASDVQVCLTMHEDDSDL